MPPTEPETEPEVVDADLVVPEPVAVPATRPGAEVAVQAAAVAGASFVAGAGMVALLKNRKARKAALRLARGRRRRKGRIEVLGTRSFLVDVHFVDRR
jgi:hypothetical protein